MATQKLMVQWIMMLVLTSVIGFSVENLSEYKISTVLLQPVEANLPIGYALIPLSFKDLANNSDLIVTGEVLDQKLTKGPGGESLVNNTLSIEKIIKGISSNKTLNVVTPPKNVEDSPNLKQGEKLILFLHKDPLLNNSYTVANSLQGKYEVIDNGTVRGFDINENGGTLSDFEKRITDELSKSNSSSLSVH